MALTVQQLLALQQLNRIGRSKVIAIGQYAENLSCINTNDLLDILHKCISDKAITGTDSMGYTHAQIDKALEKAQYIVDDAYSRGIHILSFFSSDYPLTLRNLVKTRSSRTIDSPAFLYVKGDYSRLSLNVGVALIGTREPTQEGIQAGEFFSEQFAKDGLNVISGLAIGCDSAAHRGALKAQGITTAILAHGLDRVYPKENTALAEQIIDMGGVLISEYPIGTKPDARLFVERDRLQSGLACGTVVIQTGSHGGTMHAVNSTVENCKPLFAVQYSDSFQEGMLLNHDKVQGNIMLIEEKKAKPLTRKTYHDALNCISAYASKHKAPYLPAEQLSMF